MVKIMTRHPKELSNMYRQAAEKNVKPLGKGRGVGPNLVNELFLGLGKQQLKKNAHVVFFFFVFGKEV